MLLLIDWIDSIRNNHNLLMKTQKKPEMKYSPLAFVFLINGKDYSSSLSSSFINMEKFAIYIFSSYICLQI